MSAIKGSKIVLAPSAASNESPDSTLRNKRLKQLALLPFMGIGVTGWIIDLVFNTSIILNTFNYFKIIFNTNFGNPHPTAFWLVIWGAVSLAIWVITNLIERVSPPPDQGSQGQSVSYYELSFLAKRLKQVALLPLGIGVTACFIDLVFNTSIILNHFNYFKTMFNTNFGNPHPVAFWLLMWGAMSLAIWGIAQLIEPEPQAETPVDDLEQEFPSHRFPSHTKHTLNQSRQLSSIVQFTDEEVRGMRLEVGSIIQVPEAPTLGKEFSTTTIEITRDNAEEYRGNYPQTWAADTVVVQGSEVPISALRKINKVSQLIEHFEELARLGASGAAAARPTPQMQSPT